MTIERSPVESSNVASIGYDPDTKTLAVEFKDGSVYHYHDVESSVHQELMSAKSVGKTIHSAIKGNYKHSKQ